LKIQKGREAREKKEHDEVKAHIVKDTEKVGQAKGIRKQNLTDRRNKLRQDKSKYNNRVQALEHFNEKRLEELDEYAMHNMERIDKARSKHENIQRAFGIKSDLICQKLLEETNRIKTDKIMEENKIMNKIKIVLFNRTSIIDSETTFNIWYKIF